MTRLAVDLYGYGQVARAFLPRLPGAGIRLATIRDRTGIRASRRANGFRHVLVDATSPVYDGEGAETWVAQLEDVLAGGTPIVTCNKAPLAIGWARLMRAARKGDTTISLTATVGAGTPVLPLLRRLHQAHGVARVEATLNATLGYVVDRIGKGASLAEAVRGAQRAGWAEPDPTLDLDGTDARAKAVIIHNLLFQDRPILVLDERRPRFRLREEWIRGLARSRRAPRALAVISPGRVRLTVRATRDADRDPHELGRVQVRAVLCDDSEALLVGRGAGPRSTAGGLLGDLLALADSNGDRVTGVRL